MKRSNIILRSLLMLFVVLSLMVIVSSCRTNEAFFGYEDDGNGGLILSTYKGTDINLTIPDSHDGKPVTSIATSAFFANSTLRKVTIPSSIKSIGKNTFAYCEYLKEVKFKDGCEIINESAFEGCALLKKVTLPSSSLKVIDDMAFKGCYSLRKVSFPDSVERIGYGAFDSCESLIMICGNCSPAIEYAQINSVPTKFSNTSDFRFIIILIILLILVALYFIAKKLIKNRRRTNKNGKTG